MSGEERDKSSSFVRSPWFSQPDPEKAYYVAAKAEKLVRRGPREYVMVGKKPDGSEVEVRLTPTATIRMDS